MSSVNQVLNIFEKEIGYREGARNYSKYGAWYGLPNEPWCAMFVSWCFHQAGMPLPATNSKGFAYTPSGAEWFQRNGRWGRSPRVGAIVFFKFPGSSRINHVGIVTAVHANGVISTIEGNTNAAGSRTGGGVYAKSRGSGIAGYGYPQYSTAAPRTPVGRFLPMLSDAEQKQLLSWAGRTHHELVADRDTIRQWIAQTTWVVTVLEQKVTALEAAEALRHEAVKNEVRDVGSHITKMRDSLAALIRRLFGVDPVTKNDDQVFWKR